MESKVASDPNDAERVFCIGLNKTGTTSLEQALKDLGYRVGSQPKGEKLLRAYLRREFEPIVKFSRTAEAFQDIPFSLPFTFIPLDLAFQNAKFILSVRNSADQWYESTVSSLTEFFDGVRPSSAMLKDCEYRYKGFMWESMFGVVSLPDEDPLHKQSHIDFYNSHNENVRSYFRFKSNLLEINLSHSASYARMCEFLGKEPTAEAFPWLNRSAAF